MQAYGLRAFVPRIFHTYHFGLNVQVAEGRVVRGQMDADLVPDPQLGTGFQLHTGARKILAYGGNYNVANPKVDLGIHGHADEITFLTVVTIIDAHGLSFDLVAIVDVFITKGNLPGKWLWPVSQHP
jgi:hypothetical protein